jgi:serine/threonine protein phosphatase PrpC
VPSLTFSTYSTSNSIGPLHLENQDSYLTDQNHLLFAVADGVGGYRGAKEASKIAIQGMQRRAGGISDDISFQSALREIHMEIVERANLLRYQNMGTTIAAAKALPDDLSGGTLITANVGDSPIIFFSRDAETGERCRKAYTDDSYREEEPSSMFGIIQYLGLPDCEIKVHTSKFHYANGDILLICSDGVTDNLLVPKRDGADPWTQLSKIVRGYRSAQRLAESAIYAEIKPDDMTAILIFL